MKKLIAVALLMGASTWVVAAETGPGCGVGSMIFKGQSGLPQHVLAATTNGSFGNQTFGMSTGTLGCKPTGVIQSLALYMDNNVDKVARDMSRGEGENLNTLAVLLGIPQDQRAHFTQTLQQNFAIIFPNADTTSDQAVDAIVELMEADQTLARYLG